MFRVRSASGEESLPRLVAILHGNMYRQKYILTGMATSLPLLFSPMLPSPPPPLISTPSSRLLAMTPTQASIPQRVEEKQSDTWVLLRGKGP